MMKILKFINYTKGSDKNGDYESFRRYSEFLTARTILVNRWPGVYIPPLPPKQTVVNIKA